ncbi:methyltransferase domain-containing protein [Anaerovorax odorimutans]|uniref:Methyltransferase domain-containing protein n=1 Tax=Anaerovorax odorimutans TaxID=109327 RepID=A0ABT1RPD6_9FIRM|nr:class I SAM-dependent methyltransferase [Anaerovorax odorimutans]MCQ4637055.1 methyltransferase domain-containing protein [Anaerovorax odorimutans]
MNGLINWSELYKRTAGRKPPKDDSVDLAEVWGRSADMYDRMAKMEKPYTQMQIDRILAGPEDSVMDIGCGPGRLTVPLAQKAGRVTALDLAPRMLEYCEKNVRAAGLDNVTIKEMDWETAQLGKDFEKHDVVVVSRTVALNDLIRLNQTANKYVFLLSFAQMPSLKIIRDDLFRGIEEGLMQPREDRMFGYNLTFNMLYDLGINPNVNVITDGFTKDFESREAAYDDLRLLGEVPPEKMDIFRRNVDPWLKENPQGGVTFRRETKTYIIWWEPVELEGK